MTKTQNESELLPCPYCEGIPKTIDGGTTYDIYCPECGNTEIYGYEKEVVTKAWNTRPREEKLQAQNKALLEQRSKLVEALESIAAVSDYIGREWRPYYGFLECQKAAQQALKSAREDG